MHSQHYSSVKFKRVKIVLNTVATEASSCFNLMSGELVAVEMYDTNNKRSLDLSEVKKERWLNFWKIAYFVSKFIPKETKYLTELTDPQVAVQNFKLLMRWNRTLTNIFQQLGIINVQTVVLCKFSFCIPSTIQLWNVGAWK